MGKSGSARRLFLRLSHDAVFTISSPQWLVNTGWGSGDYCTWYGISCDGGGEPQGVMLRNNGLSGVCRLAFVIG